MHAAFGEGAADDGQQARPVRGDQFHQGAVIGLVRQEFHPRPDIEMTVAPGKLARDGRQFAFGVGQAFLQRVLQLGEAGLVGDGFAVAVQHQVGIQGAAVAGRQDARVQDVESHAVEQGGHVLEQARVDRCMDEDGRAALFVAGQDGHVRRLGPLRTQYGVGMPGRFGR